MGASKFLWRGFVIVLKGCFLWLPAACVWVTLISGSPIIDLRSPEEVQEDENEAKRLDRFFDVEHLPEAEYNAEWSAKEEALSTVVEKLIRSKRFLQALQHGSSDHVSADTLADSFAEDSGTARKSRHTAASDEANLIEFSYVLPPPEPSDGDAVSRFGLTSPLDLAMGSEGYRIWIPRLVVSHRSGSLALVTLRFQHINPGKDREERWSCVALRAELVAGIGGEPASSPICDLRGPLPHGIHYMRI